ncbi:hypothetical protein [Massilia cavernae]|uniref:Transmembrane protein n=1 Tax=Massilia cavernae TaxID=2320864 RepID=A0A418XRW1_9BURK|nr:hypothetical protein [Massilia cavernae]RJG15255.1 hypothetical protein D3872_14095 [Massilia cavernae]
MGKLAGWAAIGVAVFALGPSWMRGGMSLIGLLVALAALFLSLLSVRSSGYRYFYPTAAIVVFGVLLVNDALRVWDPLPAFASSRPSWYAAIAVLVGACFFFARMLASRGR